VHGRKELPLAPDEQAGFVMTLLRLHAFRPSLAGGAVPRPVASVAKERALERLDGGVAKVPKLAVSPTANVPTASVPVGEPAPLAARSLPEPLVEKVVVPVVGAAPTGDDWHDILAALKLGGMARELGQHCELRRIDGAQVVLCLSPTHRHLQMKPAQDKLQQALSEYLGRPVLVSIDLDEVSGTTPAAAAQLKRREQQDRAVASVEQDDFVREVIDLFDAKLIESSIKPV
jgi:DNA polymerase-3 subunit gamma/tau